MKNYYYSLFPLFCLFICNTQLNAQITTVTEIASDSIVALPLIVEIQEVFVKDYRLNLRKEEINRNISIYQAKEISQMPVQSLAELLSFVGGVDIQQRGADGTQADVQIMGGTFEQVLVLLNGVKMNDPQTGHHTLNLPIPLDAIEQVEVIKGAAAKSYGLNALNGVINIITKKSFEDAVLIHAFSGLSTTEDTSRNNPYMNYGISLLTQIAGENSYQTIAVSHDKSQGFMKNTAFENNKIYFQNRTYILKGSLLETQAGYTNNAFGANGFYAAPYDENSFETVQTAFASAQLNYYAKNYWQIKPFISYRYNTDDYIFIKDNPSYYRNKHKTGLWDAMLNVTKYTSLGVLGIGAEWQNATIKSARLGDHERQNIGLFSEFHFNKWKNFSATLGIFSNYNTDFGWSIFPGIDLGYKVGNNLKLYANANKASRIPTYTDLYYVGPSNIGNDSLKQENATTSEIGFKWNTKKIQIESSYFIRNINQLIDWSKELVSDPWQPQNFGTLRTNGFQTNIKVPFYLGRNSKNLLQLNYTHLESDFAAENPQTISRYVIQSLRDQLIGGLNLGFTNKISLLTQVRYNNRVEYKDYTVVDAKLQYQAAHTSFYLQANNILNTSFNEAAEIPMPGTWVTFGVRIY